MRSCPTCGAIVVPVCPECGSPVKKANKGGTINPKKARLTLNERTVLSHLLAHPNTWFSVYDVMRGLNNGKTKRVRKAGVPILWDDHFTQVALSTLTGLTQGVGLRLIEQTKDFDNVLVNEQTQEFDTVPRPHYRLVDLQLAKDIIRRGGYLFESTPELIREP